jgi:hypothetical protein
MVRSTPYSPVVGFIPMRAIIPIILLAAPIASAQTFGPAMQCSVSIARAPDDVRAEIERWVHAESRCTNALEVRVVPTDGGLYLFARDDKGRVRERVVPDAKSAGVLVASWVADDSVGPTPVPPPAAPAPAPVSEPPAVVQISAPGMAMPTEGLVATTTTATPAHRWLSLGAMTDFDNNQGLRAEADIVVHGRWSIAGSLAVSGNHLDFMDQSNLFGTFGSMDTTDVRAVVSVAHTLTWGAWQLRLSAGLGGMYTQVTVRNNTMLPRDGDGWFPTAESAVVLSRQINERWAISAGPMVTWLVQNYKDDASTSLLIRRDAEVTGFAGLRYRL